MAPPSHVPLDLKVHFNVPFHFLYGHPFTPLSYLLLDAPFSFLPLDAPFSVFLLDTPFFILLLTTSFMSSC